MPPRRERWLPFKLSLYRNSGLHYLSRWNVQVMSTTRLLWPRRMHSVALYYDDLRNYIDGLTAQLESAEAAGSLVTQTHWKALADYRAYGLTHIYNTLERMLIIAICEFDFPVSLDERTAATMRAANHYVRVTAQQRACCTAFECRLSHSCSYIRGT